MAPSVEAGPSPSACEALARLALPHATITEARVVEARGRVSSFCRVLGASKPTADSDVRFELAIPTGTSWNGRYRQVGNGGFAGRIPEAEILQGVAAGDAVAGTDDGHASPRGIDATFAVGHPEKVIDFGYRAVKETHDAALAILGAYAARVPSHTYFTGCSDGGREALMEAQRYPGDFDGVVAGAPANAATRLLFGWAALGRRLVGAPLPAEKLRAVEAAALKACGDGDGVIDDPLACAFDPSSLRCHGASDSSCLTDAELTSLRAVYAGTRDPKTGVRILAGFEPGTEAEPGTWSDWIVGSPRGPAQLRFANTFFRSMVFADPAYDLARLDLHEDLVNVLAKLGPILDSTNPDLSAFRARGGKLLQFHGFADPAIPPRESIAYYERVRAAMGDTESFYRLFLAPGMAHCDGGPGPNVLDAYGAIVAWVEEGKAPERLAAKKFPEDDPTKPPTRSWSLCPYPTSLAWSGAGDRKKGEGYACVKVPTRVPLD